MQYKILPPPPQLKNLVECFWELESDKGETVPADYFLMADSCAEIIFQYNGGFRNYVSQSARMRFQHSVHAHFKVTDNVGFFGVRLYPHAVNQLLGMPANEAVNRVSNFCDLFKQEGTDLADQVYHSKTMSGRITLMSNFLTRKSSVNKVDPIRYFVDKVIKNDGCANMAGLQQESQLSVKQFERRFKAVAGFSPKYFARIARFQGLKNKYSAARVKTMTSLAYSGNYFDQSHFNREFKEFSGVQPLQYFKHINKDNANTFQASAINSGICEHKFDGYLRCGLFV